jgi:hypothetical protein
MRKMIDAIHALQAKTATVHERAAKRVPEWPDSISRTPRHGTLVTPYHCVYALHYPLSAGSIVRFGAEERAIRTVTSIGGDIGVAEWKQAVACQPMHVLPWDWASHIPVKRNLEDLRKPITAWRGSQTGDLYRSPVVRLAAGGVAFADAEGPIIVGDSGSPIFLALEIPVLLGCLSTGNGGSSLAHYGRELLDATNWMVREADLGH